MREVFNGWRRKAGCVGLVMSCVLAAMWIYEAAFRRLHQTTNRYPATHITCVWEPAEGRGPGGHLCQGFAGCVRFTNADHVPVTVRGNVRIYLFDNHGSVKGQHRPLHQFDFDSEAWEHHYTLEAAGPAYQVFIPDTRRNVSGAEYRLQVRLTPDVGSQVDSTITDVELGAGARHPDVSRP